MDRKLTYNNKILMEEKNKQYKRTLNVEKKRKRLSNNNRIVILILFYSILYKQRKNLMLMRRETKFNKTATIHTCY